MFKSQYKVSYTLSIMIIILATIASAGGVFMENLYQDNELTKAAWFGNDLVTLFIGVPFMIGSLVYSLRGAKSAKLVWMGALWYMVYNYMFYLYAAAFNVFFLIYVALFTLSTYALIFALVKTDAKSIAQKFHTRTPVKWIGGYLLFFGTLLGLMWIAMSASYIFTGQIPQAIVQTGHPTGVVFATDLSLLIPALILSASLLWKREPWGFVLSTIVAFKATTYSLVLIVMSVVSYLKLGILDPFLVLWVVLGLGCLLSLLFLLFNMKAVDQNCNLTESI